MEALLTTEVITTDAKWDRTAYIKLVDDQVIFDTSNDEYGPINFPIQLLIDKLKEHESRQKN